MEDRRPHPGVHAHSAIQTQVPFQRMALWYGSLDPSVPSPMDPKIHEGEQHRRGFLHPHPPPERPFPVELLNIFSLSDGFVGDPVHARV